MSETFVRKNKQAGLPYGIPFSTDLNNEKSAALLNEEQRIGRILTTGGNRH